MAFTLLLPWIRRLEDFYRFTQFLSSWTLLPSYAKMRLTFTLSPPYVRGPTTDHGRSCIVVVAIRNSFGLSIRGRPVAARPPRGFGGIRFACIAGGDLAPRHVVHYFSLRDH